MTTVDATNAPGCYDCKDGYEKIPLIGAITIFGSSITSVGQCAVKGRWIIEETLCIQYAAPTTSTGGKINDLFLACRICVDPSGTPANAVPCYKGNAKALAVTGGTACTAGELGALLKGDTTNKCLTATIIDNCKVYTGITANAGQGCD